MAFLRMQRSVESQGGGSMLVVLLLVVVVLGYVAYRMKLIPQSALAAVGLGEASVGEASGAATPGGPVGSAAHANYKSVAGSVVFEGASANIGKVSCANFPVTDTAAYEENDPCKIKVDPCKLVAKDLNGAPVCHTVEALCSSKTAPWSSKAVCSLQERGQGDKEATNNLEGVKIPAGIQLDVNSGAKCQKTSLYSDRCTASQGCAWTQDDYHADPGFQFGIAPGYQLTCDGKVQYGSPPA